MAIYWNDGATLYHYGVSGQKWGNRRYQNLDGSLTEEGRRHYGYGERGRFRVTRTYERATNSENTISEKYTKEQRKRDEAIYGKSGAKRIARAIANGTPISGARSKEAARINSARTVSKTVGKVTGTVGAVGGAIGGWALSKSFTNIMKLPLDSDVVVRSLSASGGASVGKSLGKIGGESITMLMYGYNPKKLR